MKRLDEIEKRLEAASQSASQALLDDIRWLIEAVKLAKAMDAAQEALDGALVSVLNGRLSNVDREVRDRLCERVEIARAAFREHLEGEAMKASKPRLRAKLMCDKGKRQPWWVRIGYRNGRIHSHTENYRDRRDAMNALTALGDCGVEVVE